MKPSELQDFEQAAADFARAPSDRKPEHAARLRSQVTLRNRRFLEIMASNPADALAFALPRDLRKGLPVQVEELVSGRGDIKVLIARPEIGAPTVRHEVTIGGKAYEAFVYGRRAGQVAENIPLHGVALNGRMAVSASPVRVLEKSEVDELLARGTVIRGVCPRSGKLKAGSSVVDLGGEYHYLCEGGLIHAEELDAEQTAKEGGSMPASCGNTIRSTSWTTGNKSFLYIRVNYPDDLTEPQTLASAQSMMTGTDSYIRTNSYGRSSLTGTFTPLLTLPKTKAEYNAMSDRGDAAILADSRTVAAAAGYNYSSFDFYATRFQGAGGGYGGMAYVGNRGMWMKASSVGTFAHEYGHNLGLWHSNYWAPATADPLSLTGANQEYGNPYSVMGGSGGLGHYTAFEKKILGWLPASSVLNLGATANAAPSTASTRIYTFDNANLMTDRPYSIEINSYRKLTLDFRTGNANMASALETHFVPWSRSNCGVQLVDTTFGSAGGKNDAGIAIGTTFTDPLTGISITPLGKGGTSPETLDVRVDFATVASVARQLSISGSTANIAVGSTRQFSATAYDQFGYLIPASGLTWNATGGTFNTTGLWTAPMTAGSYQVWVSSGGVESTRLTIVVYTISAASISISPLNPVVTQGGTVAFTATVRDQTGTVVSPQPTIAWTASGGTISQSGVYTGTTVGAFNVTAAASGLAAATGVTVTEPISVAISSPVAGQTFQTRSSVPVTVSASSSVVRVTVYDGGKTICTDTAAPFSCSWSTGNKQGSRSLRAVGYNASGASESSATVTVNVVR